MAFIIPGQDSKALGALTATVVLQTSTNSQITSLTSINMNNYFRDGVNFPPEITNRAVDTIQKQVLRY